MPLLGNALLVVGALALFGERIVDRILMLVWPDVEAGATPSRVYKRTRGIVGIVLVFGFGILVAFALNLNLIGEMFEGIAISDTGGKWLTALLIGGGAAPAHEVIRYIENKKAKAKEEKSQAEATTKEKMK
ncbi:MAG: hypothetical protein E3J66_03790 [Dehalococcoidia bacterium]|nr:MAG: hypothetical protein E3J66_03790 [Dehalococcoidia bacterium]